MGGVVGSEVKTSAVEVEPRLLADAVRQVLRLRGLDVTAPPYPERLDLAIVDGHAVLPPQARVVVVLPPLPGERYGRVLIDGCENEVDTGDLGGLLDRFLI